MDITPGSKVTVKITKRLTNIAAGKTLGRLFIKDPAIAARRKKKPKEFKSTPRGGRIWRVINKGTVTRPPKVGQSATFVATVDVLRDLGSVQRFVEITPA